MAETLIARLNAQGEAIVERAMKNPDVRGQLLQLARLLAEAADTLEAFEVEDCEHCGRRMYQAVTAPTEPA